MSNLHSILLKVSRSGEGIFSQVYEHTKDFSGYERKETLEELFNLVEGWSGGTGKALYPDDTKPANEFQVRPHEGESPWIGQYAASRNHLLTYLLEQTK